MNSRKRATLLIFSLLNVVSSFAIQIYSIKLFGVGIETDAYFVATAIPNLVVLVSVGALSGILVPYLSGKGIRRANRDTWGILLYVTVFFIFIYSLIYAFSNYYIPIIFFGFDASTINLAVELTQIQALTIIFSPGAAILISYMHSRGKHSLAEFIPGFSSSLILLFLFFFSEVKDIKTVAIYATLLPILQYFFLLLFTPIPNYKSLVSFRTKNTLKDVITLSLGSLYYKSGSIVDKSLLSSGNHGSVTSYHLSERIVGILTILMNKVFVTPAIRELKQVLLKEGELFFIKCVKTKVKKVGGISLLLVILYVIFGVFIFDCLNKVVSIEEYKDILFQLILIMLGGFVANITSSILSSSLYSLGNVRKPTLMSIITYTIYFPIKFLLFSYYSIFGVAIAYSTHAIVNAIILWYMMSNSKGKS